MRNAVEMIGFGLILGFLWTIWPPLVLLGAGLLLIVWANMRPGQGRLGAAAGAAWAAARRAYRHQEQTAELRSVA